MSNSPGTGVQKTGSKPNVLVEKIEDKQKNDSGKEQEMKLVKNDSKAEIQKKDSKIKQNELQKEKENIVKTKSNEAIVQAGNNPDAGNYENLTDLPPKKAEDSFSFCKWLSTSLGLGSIPKEAVIPSKKVEPAQPLPPTPQTKPKGADDTKYEFLASAQGQLTPPQATITK